MSERIERSHIYVIRVVDHEQKRSLNGNAFDQLTKRRPDFVLSIGAG